MIRENLPSARPHLSLAVLAAWGLTVFLCGTASAAIVTHTPTSGPNPAPFSPAFGSVLPGDTAGIRYINFGVDYSNSVAVGVFNDPPPAFGGINTSGQIDLLAPVNGRIVVLGSTAQGLTSSVTVTAGSSSPNTLLLEVFNLNNALLGSQVNTLGGISTFGVTRGQADIASFRVSTPGSDTFGVDQVSIETPVGVPEPTACALMISLGWMGLGCYRSSRRSRR